MNGSCHRWRGVMLSVGVLILANLASAGVIQGTGSVPTATQLGATDAVRFHMTESGSGHLLVVPYFTAQAGQMSVLHLVNTDFVNGKAVKLRYRGAGNADTLLDMVVFLSPGDVWAGAVNAGVDGKAQITTVDRSCTLPRIEPGQAQSFSVARLSPKWTSEVQANNTREGYVEAIVMADIPSRAVYGFKDSEKSMLFTAINHVAGVAPCTTSVIDAALLNDTSVEAVAASRGFATPTGGLTGKWYIIDVPGSTTFSGSATAFRAVNSNGKAARGNYVVFPQSSEAVTEPERYTADPLLVSAGLAGHNKTADGELGILSTAPALQAQFSDLPDLSTPYYLEASPFNARRTAGDLTQIMTVKYVRNQYANDALISAKTDWVFSMPTMRYSVAVNYSAEPTSRQRWLYSSLPTDAGSDQHFHAVNLSASGTAISTVSYFLGVADREGVGLPHQTTFLEGQSNVLVGAVSVASVGKVQSDRPTALSASVTLRHPYEGVYSYRFFNRWPENGWVSLGVLIDLNHPGLPILGASFIKLTNPSAQPGVSANYGITWPHAYLR